MNENVVTIEGNLTRDVELTITPSGAAVAEFGVAVNRRYKKQGADDFTEEVSYIDVAAWRQLGENTAESVSSGDRVIVTGRLEQQRWVDKETEKNRSKVVLIADSIAPSLRWATVSITKNPKKGASDGAPGPAGDDSDKPF